MTTPLALALLLASWVWVCPPGFGQRPGGQWTSEDKLYGKEQSGSLGWAVAGPGDLDFDGYADLLVGAPGESLNQGAVYAYSGKDRNPLWQWTRTGTCNCGESLNGAGDVNGDGSPDVIVGIPECSQVATLLNDSTVWWTAQGTENLGIAVAGAGDVNLDGFHDVIAGESLASPNGLAQAGSAYVYSGRSGVLLYRFDGQVPGDRLGGYLGVGGAGDANGDGWPDLIVGAERADPGGILNAGAAYLYSGRDGSLLRQFSGTQPDMRFGTPCSGAGDLDGDGYDDVVVGALGAAFNGSFSGSVFAYSGRTGSLLYRLDGKQAYDWFGTSIASLEDVNLDGVRDLAVGSTEGTNGTTLGRIDVYSGADGSLLDMIVGLGGTFGWSLASAGDVDGDLWPDLIAGAPEFDAPGNFDNQEGAAFLYSFDPFLYADATELSATSGLPVQVGLYFPKSEGGQAYALLFSGAGTGPTTLGGIEVPLGAGPLLSQMLTGRAPPNVQGAFGTLRGGGEANAVIASDPRLAALVGRTFHMAAVSYDSTTLQARRTSIAWPLTVVL